VTRLTRGGRQQRWFCYSALLGLGAGLLASCTMQGRQPASAAGAGRPPSPPLEAAVPSTVPHPAHKPAPPAPAPNPLPAAGEQAIAAGEPNPAAAPQSTASSPEVAALSPPLSTVSPPPQIELIGLDQSAATRLFGPATERLEQPPATIWRYKSGTCELDLFFYLDLRSGRMRTLHYAFKDGAAATSRRQDCLRSLIASRAS
jgi:hypothetical protein